MTLEGYCSLRNYKMGNPNYEKVGTLVAFLKMSKSPCNQESEVQHFWQFGMQ